MKKIYTLLLLLFVAFVSCNDEKEDFSTFQNQKNMEQLKQIALEYGIKSIDIKCIKERITPFSSEEIAYYKSFFQKLSELRKSKTEGTFTATKDGNYYKGILAPPIMTRESHQGTSDYKGFPIKVFILWDISNNQPVNHSASAYYFHMPKNETVAYRFKDHYAYTTNFFPNSPELLSATIQGTFRVEGYTFSSSYPNKADVEAGRIHPNYVINEKIVIIGSFNTKTLEGSFSTRFEGPGEWPPYI